MELLLITASCYFHCLVHVLFATLPCSCTFCYQDMGTPDRQTFDAMSHTKTQTLALSLSSQTDTQRGRVDGAQSHARITGHHNAEGRAFPTSVTQTLQVSVTQTLQVQVSHRHHHNKCDTLNTTAVSTHGHTPGQTHHQDTETLSLDNTQSTTLISMTSVFLPSLQLSSQYKVTRLKYSQPMQALVMTCNHQA